MFGRKKTLLVNKNLDNFSYLDQRLREFGRMERENEHFYSFECSSFFKGETIAKLNTKIYFKRYHHIERKIKQVNFIINNLEKKLEEEIENEDS